MIEYNIRIGVTSSPMILRMLKNPVATVNEDRAERKARPVLQHRTITSAVRSPLAGFGYPFTQVRGPQLPLEVKGKFDCDVWWNEVARGANDTLVRPPVIASRGCHRPRARNSTRALAKAYANIAKDPRGRYGHYRTVDVGDNLVASQGRLDHRILLTSRAPMTVFCRTVNGDD